MDMGGTGHVPTGAAAPRLRGADASFLPAAASDDDDVFRTTTTAVARSTTSYFMGGAAGSFALNGAATPSPSEASAFSKAALAASYCSVPANDAAADRGSREESHDQHHQHQPQTRHAVYGPYPRASGGDGGGGRREGVAYGWGPPRPPPHEESPWQAGDQRSQVNQEGRAQQAVGVHAGGIAGARGNGDGGISKMQRAGMHAVEQELLEHAQRSSKRARISTTAPPLPAAFGTGFPPRSRGLTYLQQQQNTSHIHNAMGSVSTTSSPGTLVARVPVHAGGPTQPTTAIRRRHRGGGGSTQEENPKLPAATTSGRQEKDRRPHSKEENFETIQQPGRTRAGAKIPTTTRRKRNIAARCQHPGCSRGSTFGPGDGARKATSCAAHKREGMVKITSRQCVDDACSTAPSYGFEGKRATCCSRHKAPGMVNVVTPRCQRDECGSCASYGHMAERRPLFCARHAQDGMVNVVSRKCLGAGCLKNPSYGHPGDRRASFCVDHHVAGMSNIVSPKCLAPGCGKAPSFGTPGGQKATWCKAHKQDAMVNLLYSRQLQKCGM